MLRSLGQSIILSLLERGKLLISIAPPLLRPCPLCQGSTGGFAISRWHDDTEAPGPVVVRTKQGMR
jgi:hypothetical protein